MRNEIACPDCGSVLLEFDPDSGMYHCINHACNFAYFDKNTGTKYRRAAK